MATSGDERMRRKFAGWLAGVLFFSLVTSVAFAEDVLLFTYFRDNGQHGVNLAMTTNGVDFVALNDDKPVFKPPGWTGQNLTRDASIIYREGMFRMVWTSNWKGKIFGYAESPDLVHWSKPKQIRPFSESLPMDDQPENIWAPEIHWDPLEQNYFILFASTTPRERKDNDNSNNDGKNGSQYDNRMYITRTKDFDTFSDAKLFFDRGFASIDAVMQRDDANDRWVMVIKCSRDWNLKTMPGRNLWITYTGLDLNHLDFSPLEGPIAGNHSPMFSHSEPRKSMAEGPSLLYYRDRWLLIWDEPAGNGFQLATTRISRIGHISRKRSFRLTVSMARFLSRQKTQLAGWQNLRSLPDDSCWRTRTQ